MFYVIMILPKFIIKRGGYQTLAYHNTIFAQILELISRHEFEILAEQYDHGPKLRKMNRWSQFVAMSSAQLTGRHSLRDLTAALSSQAHKLYHLGCRRVTRSTLARVNEQKPYTFYEALFYKLLNRCQSVAPRHRFRFKNKLYSLDATVIDLCLNVFPWAEFRKSKGAIKVHAGLDHDGYIPAFIAVSPGCIHELKPARFLNLPKHSIVVFDRGYTDYSWYNELNEQSIFFVTRMKRNANYEIIQSHDSNTKQGVIADQTIQLTGSKAGECPIPLRRVVYQDSDLDKEYVFLTNHLKLSARTIADIYKERWQIELFFKWIKQNLKIKSFLGTSHNAVLTQVWVAMCMCLILAYIKFTSKLKRSLQQILRLLHLNLFERRDLMELLKCTKYPVIKKQNPMQLRLI